MRGGFLGVVFVRAALPPDLVQQYPVFVPLGSNDVVHFILVFTAVGLTVGLLLLATLNPARFGPL